MEIISQDILKEIRDRIIQRNETVAVAESVTSGLLQFSFSMMPDGAQFFQGGITAYNLQQKVKHLEVEREHADRVDCVSPQVASQMAIGIAKKFESDWGISITGYATPVPESNNAVFAFFTVSFRGMIVQHDKISSNIIAPQEVQTYFVNQVLTYFNKQLEIHPMSSNSE